MKPEILINANYVILEPCQSKQKEIEIVYKGTIVGYVYKSRWSM